ncbi:tetratricopeptide repeat protein [Qipengyuania sp.]|uniref:tetratricopeptide repeat protein n=1 Tax=Qipengyuania sp. TaxID=2004515 RepID=UPI003735DE65
MARTPTPALTSDEKRARADAAQQNALLQEVDDAVRRSDLDSFIARYGKPLLALLVVLLLAFAAYLFWQHRQNVAREKDAEVLITALDQIQAGNLPAADQRLTALSAEDNTATGAAARLLRGGLAAERGDAAGAARLFAEVASDAGAPQALRDVARIREVATRYDSMKPADVIAALKPLAVPGRPYFAGAGELVAHAYLAQGQRAEAGTLFAQIAKDPDTPQSARSRMLNMAGILGVDAVDDVREVLEAQGVQPAPQTDGAAAASPETE